MAKIIPFEGRDNTLTAKDIEFVLYVIRNGHYPFTQMDQAKATYAKFKGMYDTINKGEELPAFEIKGGK